MMPHNKWLNIGLIFTVCYCFFFSYTVEAQSSQKGKKKKEVSIIKKGWDDVTTRNNYYFNAKRIWEEMLKEQSRNAQINYNDTLPFYFHDMQPGLSGNTAELQQIIIKTGITLQRHDYSRWKDDCYTLLGKAYFAKNELDSALINFQYVSTALRGKFNDSKVAISQKDILKAKQAKQKELDKLAKDKKKAIEQKEKEKKAESAKAAEDKKKRIEAAAKAKEKELQRKIKAKEKMLKQKAKGKYKPPTNTASKTTPAKAPKPKSDKNKKSAGNILDKISEGVTIDFDGKGSESDLKKAENKVKALEYTKNKLEAANVEDSLTQKQLETLHKLTLWEKIKHLRSRPEALVWMTKTMVKQGNFKDAESIVEYSKTLVKLRKSQRKEIQLVQSYFFYNRGQVITAAESLEAALPFIKKKKEKNYYNFLLAQLTTSSDPAKSYDIYKNLFEKGKDETIRFNALEKMYFLTKSQKVINDEMPEIVKSYNKFSKSKLVGDKALFTLAHISLEEQDTTKAIEQLNKAIAYNFSSPDQKAKALSLLGDLSYDKYDFKNAYVFYDSARTLIVTDTSQKLFLGVKTKVLKEIVTQQDLAYQQDSLLYLSSLTREELAQYIKDQNKIERKAKRGRNMIAGDDANFSSVGLGNNANFNTSQDQYTNKGQWYFYNVDMRTRGFNEFKQMWGERPYINNWRRGEAIQQNSMGISELVKKANDSIDVEPVKVQYKIPSTDEEFEKSHDILANTYMIRANSFHNELSNRPATLLYLDSLLTRFPQHKFVPEALYLKMLSYTEANQMTLAEKTANELLEKYPDHTLSQKILDNRKIKYVKKEDNRTPQAEVLYASLYGLYQEEKFDKVIEGKMDFINRYGNEKLLMPKVLFLEALSLAKIAKLDEYKDVLQSIIKSYSGTPEAEKAQLYLNVLASNTKKSTSEVNEDEKLSTPQVKELFKYEEGYHFILIKLANKKQNSIAAVEKINAEMDKLFPKQRIRASNSYLDAKNPLLLIKRFENIADAKKGMEALKYSTDQDVKSSTEGSEILLISQDNFKELFTNKNYEEYKAFYEQQYNGEN